MAQQQEWVEIVDPATKKPFFANTVSGECSWDKPVNVELRLKQPGAVEWWELFDQNHKLPYYYNTKTSQTEWVAPTNDEAFVISLVALQRVSGQSGFPTPRPVGLDVKSNGTPKEAEPKNGLSSNKSEMNLKGGSVRSLPNQLMSEISQFKLEGFAQKYFSTHKKGILRKKVPLVKMLEFTKDAISQPLMTMNKDLHKDAIKTFKLVQRVMSDRPAKVGVKSNSEDIQEILTYGVNRGEMRDEIYCQVCRQLNANPNTESVHKGWELMSCLVVTFPPSKNFQSYLENYMVEKKDETKDEKIITFVKHCQVRLERIAFKGPRGKVPTIPEIDRAKEAPFFPSVFGETLADVMAAQQEKYPERKLPVILTFLTEQILAMNGCQTEGIFRVPGDADAITDLRLRLEKNVYDCTGIRDASVPASLLKFWLRDLTDPLIPQDLYDFCIKNAEKPEKAAEVLNMIPEHNRNVLMYLINFLQIVGDPKNQDATRMSVKNIAMVFAPNILRCPSDNLQLILENTKYEQGFVRSLMQYLQTDAVKTMK